MSTLSDVYVSTACLPGVSSVQEKIDSFIRTGFHFIELGAGVKFKSSDIEYIKALPCHYLLHNYFPPPLEPFVLNLASLDSQVFSRSLELCRCAIHLSAELGGLFYSVHSGLRIDPDPEHLGRKLPTRSIVPYEIAYSRLVETLQVLCDIGGRLSVAIAVEPNVVAGFNLTDGRNEIALIATPEELTRLRCDVDRANLGFLIDVGHLKVTANTLDFDPFDFVERVSDCILGFHLSDNNGITDQHRAFGSDAWFLPILDDFPNIPRILECNVSDVTELLRCRDVLLGRG